VQHDHAHVAFSDLLLTGLTSAAAAQSNSTVAMPERCKRRRRFADLMVFHANQHNVRMCARIARWLDLFASFPSLAGRVPVEVFLQLVPLVHSRYYSIASSFEACPGEVRAIQPARISTVFGLSCRVM
jgi:sulfite reductase alpha subunit-like flavoprotein